MTKQKLSTETINPFFYHWLTELELEAIKRKINGVQIEELPEDEHNEQNTGNKATRKERKGKK